MQRRSTAFLVSSYCLLISVPAFGQQAFNLIAPPRGAIVPTNARIFGTAFGDPERIVGIAGTVRVSSAEPVPFGFELARCGTAGCLGEADLGLLPAAEDVQVDVTSESGSSSIQYRTAGGPDDQKPEVGSRLVTFGVQRSLNESTGGWTLQRNVAFRPSAASDDFGISGFALARRFMEDGDDYVIIRRRDGPELPDAFADTMSAEYATGVACYVTWVWDWAGNRGESGEECVDLAVSDEEAESLTGCSCTTAQRSSGPFLIVLSSVLVAICRRRGLRR